MAIEILHEFLPEAERLRLGGIKVGDTLSIDNGVLNTNAEEVAKNVNRITTIEGKIQVSASTSTVTLSEGSIVYIPDGFESDEITPKYKTFTTLSNHTYNDISEKGTIFCVTDEDTSYYTNVQNCYSGAITPTITTQYALWYDTANNIIKRTNDTGSTWIEGVSLPVSYAHANGTVFDKFIAFDGFGYLATEIFVLPTVHGILPYGRSIDSGLPATLAINPSRVLRCTAPGPYQTFNLCYNETNVLLTNDFYYDAKDNINRNSANAIQNYIITNCEILTNSNSEVSDFAPGYVSVNEAVQYPYINHSNNLNSTYWLNSNKGRVFLDSRNNSGNYTAFERYKSQNGVFVTAGYQRNFLVNYTADSTIAANTNQVTHQIILLDEDGNTSFPGSVTATGNIIATASQALWADLAEKYESDNKYPIGTLIAFGGKKEITIAKNKVNGVISEKPGFVLNKRSKGQPVALAGKTKVRVFGLINKGDKLVLYKDGIAKRKKWYDIFKKTIGIALESNTNSKEKLVMSVVHLVV